MERAPAIPFADVLPPRYRIERVLAESERSATLQAFDTGIRQAPAVVKVERLADETGPEIEAGFRGFCSTLAAIQDDRVAVPYTFGTLATNSGGTFGYTARAYVTGTPLSGLVLPMTAEAMLIATLQVCEGLSTLHAKGLFHCDIKPENVIVRHAQSGRIDERSQCVLIDIAYRPGAGAGTLAEFTLQYVAPERLEGRPADGRTDLYAVGVMAYRLLAGRLPFDGNSLPEMIRKQRAREFPRLATLRPDVPRGLCDVLERLLEPNPDNRPESVEALIALLHEHAGVASTGARSMMRARRFVGRETELAACIAALGLDRPSTGVSSLDVSGARGCGVTAFLRELQDRLEARGVTVLTASPRAIAGKALPSQILDAVHALARRPHGSSVERLRAPRTTTELLDDLLVATEDRRVVLFVDDWRLGDVGECHFLQRLIAQDRAANDAMPGRTGRCQVVVGDTSEGHPDAATEAVAATIGRRIRLEGLAREDVARLLAGENTFPRAFAARLHFATGGSPSAIRTVLDRVLSNGTFPTEEQLETLLEEVSRDVDPRPREIGALRAAPHGSALLALALWADEMDLESWEAIAAGLEGTVPSDLPVERIERAGQVRVRSRHRHLCEPLARHLSRPELDRIGEAVLVATRSAWRSGDPAELMSLLRFVARLGRLPPRVRWGICRALILLLERGCFADVETVSTRLARCHGAPWWVGLFHEAARAGASATHEATPQGTAAGVCDAPSFFRSWIRARRLLRARYRKEALEILDALWVAPLGCVPAVSLALAEDRALAAAEAREASVLADMTRWIFHRTRRSFALVRRRGRRAARATIRARLRACRQVSRYQRVRGRSHMLKRKTGSALVACRRERLLNRAHANALREASCLNNEGILLARARCDAASVAALEKSVRLRERLDDEGGLAISLINLAAALSVTGNLGGAAAVLNRARIVATRNGLGRLRNLSLLNLAVAYCRRGQLRDAHRVLRQARRTTRDDRDAEAQASALFNSGRLAVDRWNPVAAECLARELDRIHTGSGGIAVQHRGDLIRAELAYRSRDWAHLHTVVARMSGHGVDRSLTALYDASVAIESGERPRKNRASERDATAGARLRLALVRRFQTGIRLVSLVRVLRLARHHACLREAVEWIIAHLARPEGDGEESLNLSLKALSWFEFREGHDDLQIELRARLAGMLRARGRQAEAWRLVEDAVQRFRRLERRLRRWPRGMHVLLHLQDRLQCALRGATVPSGGGQELSASLCVQAFDLLMENRKRNIGGQEQHAAALLRLGSALGQAREPDTFIDEVLSVALAATGAQRAVLITGTPKSHEVRRALLASGAPTSGMRLDISWAVVSQVLSSGESSLFSDALTSEELASHRSIATFKLRSLACVPLRAAGQVLGGLYLDHDGIAGLITSEMLGLLELLAAQIALVIRMGEMENRTVVARRELAEAHRHLMRAERNRVAGELAGGLVHDLKNVLAAVSGRAQLLRRANSDPNVLRSVDAIERAAGTGVGLLQRLQECARDHSSQSEETVDLVTVAREAIELLGPRLEKSRVRTDVTGAPEAVAWGVPGEFRELFLNLFVNACDAMPEGGTLSVAFEVNAHAGQVEVTVSDTGVGMPAETKARIFEPFFTTKGNSGTGLGLVVVRSVLVHHGGSIEVDSSPGMGTRFRLALPCVAKHGLDGHEKGRLVPKRPSQGS